MPSQPAARTANCPICQGATTQLLTMQFGRKLNLPTELPLRHCAHDNFLFVARGLQADYDQFYAGAASDTHHQEVAGESIRSPIAQLQATQLAKALDGFFVEPRRVLDYGCGAGGLLLELATLFPDSQFHGFDPGPAAETARESAQSLGLANLTVSGLSECENSGPYDMIIASHVLEHIIDFEMIASLNSLLTANGILYIEVPNALEYRAYSRLEFLYYFDRLHVNHFSPTALANLFGEFGFGYLNHFCYAFPYRDRGEYPALGMIFRKGFESQQVNSEDLLGASRSYIELEQLRATQMIDNLATLGGVLVWGAGDNFYRSLQNRGPLSGPTKMIIIDRNPQEIMVRGHCQDTIDPQVGISANSWPVAITVSEARGEIAKRVHDIDPEREVFFL